MDDAAALPLDIARELDRVRDRWVALPLARAEQAAPAVAAVVAELGARSAAALGRGDAGPEGLDLAVLPDALAVVVRDCVLAGVDDDVLDRLVELRRALP